MYALAVPRFPSVSVFRIDMGDFPERPRGRRQLPDRDATVRFLFEDGCPVLRVVQYCKRGNCENVAFEQTFDHTGIHDEGRFLEGHAVVETMVRLIDRVEAALGSVGDCAAEVTDGVGQDLGDRFAIYREHTKRGELAEVSQEEHVEILADLEKLQRALPLRKDLQ
jgi:hypothetical protein